MLKNDWNATPFFEELVAKNKLAIANKFVFCKVSGLEGFEEALHTMQKATAFFCISDIADGYTDLNNTPRTRRVKTIFIAMRHAVDDMDARNECMETMRELFRQMMSVITLQRIKLEQNNIYLDPRISFNEIDRYFFSGCACAYFQIAVDVFTDLVFRKAEWNNFSVAPDTEYMPITYDPSLERNTYSIWLINYAVNKPAIVKIIMDYFVISISSAKLIVENAPCNVGVVPTFEEAYYICCKLNDKQNGIAEIRAPR